MTDKIPLELQVKELQKSMLTIVKALKDMRTSVNKLEEKANKSHDDDIQDLVNCQKTLELIVNANSEAIKRIDDEILDIKNDKAKAETNKKNDVHTKEEVGKKCKYFNSGHCKYKSECKFSHPKEICKAYLEGRKCNQKTCLSRHPKACKWSQGRSGCTRQNCDYLHVTLALDDGHQNEAHNGFPCVGCKNCYTDTTCVVQHISGNIQFYLCLNCEDWIQDKEKILNPGWSLFDQNGDLRRDV